MAHNCITLCCLIAWLQFQNNGHSYTTPVFQWTFGGRQKTNRKQMRALMFVFLKTNLIWCDAGYSGLLSVSHSVLVVWVLELELETQRSDLSRGDFNLKCFVPRMKRTVFSAGVAHWHEPMGQKEIQKLGYSSHYAFLMTGTEHALHGRVPLKAFSKKGRRLAQVPFQSRSDFMRVWPKTEKNGPTTSSTNMVWNTTSVRVGIKKKK